MLWSRDGGLAAGRRREAEGRPALRRRPVVPPDRWAPGPSATRRPTLLLAVADRRATRTGTPWSVAASSSIPRPGGRTRPGPGGARTSSRSPRSVNGIPQVFALWPHAASLMLRGQPSKPDAGRAGARGARPRIGGRPSPAGTPTAAGSSIDTPYTQGLAGWPGRDAAVVRDPGDRDRHTLTPSSSPRRSAPSRSPSHARLLVTAVARVEPTGFRWVDGWKREVADPGRPPLLQEPVEARVRWRRKGAVKAYALDNTRGPGRPGQARDDRRRRRARHRRATPDPPLGTRRVGRERSRRSGPGAAMRTTHADHRHRRRRLHRVAPGRSPPGRRGRGRRRRQLRPVLSPAASSEANLAAARRHPRFRLVELDIRDAAGGRAPGPARRGPTRSSTWRPGPGSGRASRTRRSTPTVNVVGTVHLLEAACRLEPRPRFVYASSSSVYGDRPTPRSARPTRSTSRSAPTPPPRRPASCWPTPSTTSTACP